MRRRMTTYAGLFAALLVAAAAACSLGLDESLIGKTRDDGGVSFETGAPDVVAVVPDSSLPPDASSPTCASDGECTSTDGCLKGKCDLVSKRCVYDVCRPAACKAAACASPTHACGTPVSYKLLAAQFPVGALALPRGSVAVYPWLYIATQTGLLAFDVSNPTASVARQVPVVGLGFVPTSVVASGGRVWLVGGATGTGPSRVQLAYVDSPIDPFATTIPAHSFLPSSTRPAEALLPFSRSGDSVLLVAPADPFPAVAVSTPIVEPLALNLTAPEGGAGLTPGAVSGTRLLVSAVGADGSEFALIDNAGSATAAIGPLVTYADAGAVSAHRAFTQTDDGAIFWATGVHDLVPTPSTRAVRAYFIVSGGMTPIDSTQRGVELESYAATDAGGDAADDAGNTVTLLPPNAPVFGSNDATAAMVDSMTAMVAMQAHEAVGQTAVEFVKRVPLGVIKDGANPRRQLLNIDVATVVATAGDNGLGYVVANNKAATATVYMFDPACAP